MFEMINNIIEAVEGGWNHLYTINKVILTIIILPFSIQWLCLLVKGIMWLVSVWLN